VKRIRDDGIDILVDLAGHTAGNSLKVFARQAAPIQVTWLGYPNTTGLEGMRCRIVDPVVDPPGQDSYYTENLVRLPGCFLCYKPPADAPAVSILPAAESAQLTFGSFNNLTKINDGVIRLWSEVIKAVPGSRLLLKNSSLTDEKTRLHYQQKFLEHGLDRECIELIGHTPTRQEHLALYDLVDIGLDTFPYNGTTTTCEALWMGVPVLTVAGEYHAGRVGLTLLEAAGLSDWVSDSDKDFIENAVKKSENLSKLSALRAGLRERLLASDLCNAAQFTSNLEHAYRGMWQEWLC
jgi:predicted O-linked N-acetylglucosamine transferase (SPINDLY family)